MLWQFTAFWVVYSMVVFLKAWEHFTGKPLIPRPPPLVVEFDDFAVTERKGDEIVKEFWWDSLTRIAIYTNSWGHAWEDFFYILWDESEKQDMSIGLDLAVGIGLNDYIESFVDLDWAEYSLAQRAMSENYFIVWERES